MFNGLAAHNSFSNSYSMNVYLNVGIKNDQKSWKTLREEGECSTDEEFIAELADLKNSLSMERSECVQVKWIRPDEDGLMFEFCTLTLNLDTTKIYDIIDALLKERNIYHDNAVKGDTIVADMERRLELLGKKVEEMDNYRRNLSNTLISKFAVIQNEKAKS
ncbi:Ketol-acid reductoisomerase (NADP(+)) [Dirofilaria immitis]